MRARIAALALAALVAGCSSGSSTPPPPLPIPTPKANAAAALPSPGASVVALHQTAAPLSVVIHIPKKIASKRSAAKLRSKQYISPSTQTLAVTVVPAGADGGNVSVTCTSGEPCTASVGLPLLTNGQTVTVTMKLSDGSSNVLSQGTQTLTFGTSYSQGTATTISPVLDAVAVEVDAFEAYDSLIQGQSGTFAAGFTFYDADGNDITQYAWSIPGQRIVDSLGNVLGDYSGAATALTVTSSDTNVTFGPVVYVPSEGPGSFQSTGTYNGQFSTSGVTYTPALASNPANVSFYNATSSFQPAQLAFVSSTFGSDTQMISNTDGSETLEFGNLAAHSGGSVSLQSNYSSSNSYSIVSDSCTGPVIDSAFGTALAATTSMPAAATQAFAMNELTQSSPGSCTITVQDANNVQAVLHIAVDKTTITVNSKTRKR